jgi:hypothetical protein
MMALTKRFTLYTFFNCQYYGSDQKVHTVQYFGSDQKVYTVHFFQLSILWLGPKSSHCTLFSPKGSHCTLFQLFNSVALIKSFNVHFFQLTILWYGPKNSHCTLLSTVQYYDSDKKVYTVHFFNLFNLVVHVSNC